MSDRVRLFYIGLWTQTDDAGFFEWSPSELAAELYRYLPNGRRTKLVVEALEELVAFGRVVHLECVEHGVVPTIPEHRIQGGEKAFTFKKRHESRCLRGPDVVIRREVSASVSESVSESVPLSVPVSLDAQARREKTLTDASIEAGGFVADLAARRATKAVAGA